ncbi:MAG: zf-HC2 domain-containing protein [Candidatus Aureabacteria bacterium]|nr:zf-HC2 domain-containing protein [Candidatus Auribacterota bacterium]
MRCCTQATIERYADGELSPARRRRVEAHTAACPACRELLRSVHTFNAVLRAAGARLGRETTAACPRGETIAALMEGAISSAEERGCVAAHIAECGACAARAAEAAEAARLVRRLEASGLKRPPRRVCKAVRQALLEDEPAFIGELAASIKNLFARLAPPSGEAVSAPASAWAVAEPNAPYPHRTGARTPTAGKPVGRRGAAGARCIGVKRAPGPATPNRFPPGGPVIRSFSHGRLAVDLSLAAAVNGAVACTVRLADRRGTPLRSVLVEMRKGAATLCTAPTGKTGEVVFDGLVCGQYQFLIRRGAGARIGVTLA